MMHSLNLAPSFRSSALLFHDQRRVMEIDLGNNISDTVDRAEKKLKSFWGNCLVDVIKSVLVLGKASMLFYPTMP